MVFEDFQEEFNRFSESTMTVAQAAAYLGTTRSAVYRLIDKKYLESLNFKNQKYVLFADVESYKRWRLIKERKMPFLHDKNLYQGVNPHLLSLYQTPRWGSYKSFHSDYTSEIKKYINQLLPPGYRAWQQDTLNILRQSGNVNLPSQKREPDVSIRLRRLEQPTKKTTSFVPVATPDFYAPFPVPALEAISLAIVIYRMDSSEVGKRGQPVTIIELLSPGNKVSYGLVDYQQKRYELLQAEIALVEIDFLHETTALLPTMPIYPSDEKSTPYYLAVSNPRLSTESEVYRFSVNQPIPTISIPLLEDEQIVCNFDEIFQLAYHEQFWWEDVDYDVEPVRMHTYSMADQQRIREQMTYLADNRQAYLPNEKN